MTTVTEAVRLKYIAELNMGQSPSGEIGLLDENPEVLPFMQGNAEFGAKYPTPRFTCSEPPKRAKPEDLLISVRAPVGALNICNQEVGIGRGLCAMSWRKIIPQYGWWVMHEKKSDLDVEATGSTYKAVSVEVVGNLRLPVPPEFCQMAVCENLDAETARIDELIEAKESMLQLLEQKRAALISRAVTRGLDPKVPTKPSGLDWLGEIPKHWEQKKISRMFTQVKRLGFPELPVLSVYRDYGVIDRNSRDDNANKVPEDLSKYQLVEKGDLVINKMKAWQGSMGISEYTGITSPDYVVFSPTHDEDPEFINCLLRNRQMTSVYLSMSNGIRTNQWRIEPDRFLSYRLFLPPLIEQRAIVTELETRQKEAAKLIDALQDSIKLLKERRSALITAAVTGQIPIPGSQLKRSNCREP